MPTLAVRDLSKTFRIRHGLRTTPNHAVRNVSFDLISGRTVALVGQSGSGKSTVARMIAKLETPTSGQILLDDVAVGHRGLKAYRDEVQMVFQDPFASLNPFHTVFHHLARPIQLHGVATGEAAVREKVNELLERVRLTPGDEPVSMLDVSIRLGILRLLARLQREENLAVLYITHDLATARHFSDEILVMLAGEVVERGPADEVILHPKAEFTRRLAEAAPEPSRNRRFADSAERYVSRKRADEPPTS
jgi:ABC-type glutathione transport system ATPase component